MKMHIDSKLTQIYEKTQIKLSELQFAFAALVNFIESHKYKKMKIIRQDLEKLGI